MNWYPLRFAPIYRQYMWGGHRFRTSLGRDLDPAAIFAESWEICDHGQDTSRVLFGPLAGKTLHDLVLAHGPEVIGVQGVCAQRALDRKEFPLILKYLDGQLNLSIQVHPDNAMAAQLDPPDLGKTEAWVVLETSPGSLIHAGLKPGVDRRQFEASLRSGHGDECVHSFEARPGEGVLLPAGMVHALGAGSLIAEIQQASDTTFRLFDWNRPGPDGKPRPLHHDRGLEAVDFSLGPARPIRIPSAPDNRPVVLAECDEFVLSRQVVTAASPVGVPGRFCMMSVLEGALTLADDPAETPLRRGQSALLPAALGPVLATPEQKAVLLLATCPA